MMKERPIIFNAEMVRAILDGRKTQTRRVVKSDCMEVAEKDDGSPWPWREDCERGGDIWYPCPFGQPGDQLYIREAFRVHSRATDVATLVYRASERNSWTEQTRRVPVSVCNKPVSPEKWTPSIHMPRWASRITLEITSVRVERLNDISDSDALAEGVSTAQMHSGESISDVFGRLWQSIYGEESWSSNPWVWVIEFKRMVGE